MEIGLHPPPYDVRCYRRTGNERRARLIYAGAARSGPALDDSPKLLLRVVYNGCQEGLQNAGLTSTSSPLMGFKNRFPLPPPFWLLKRKLSRLAHFEATLSLSQWNLRSSSNARANIKFPACNICYTLLLFFCLVIHRCLLGKTNAKLE